MITKCVGTTSIFFRLQIDIDNFYRLQSHLTSQTEHNSRSGIVRDTVKHILNLNLAPTLIILPLTLSQKISYRRIDL